MVCSVWLRCTNVRRNECNKLFYSCFCPSAVRMSRPAASCATNRFARQPSSAFSTAALCSAGNPLTISCAVSIPLSLTRKSNFRSNAVARNVFCGCGMVCSICIDSIRFLRKFQRRDGTDKKSLLKSAYNRMLVFFQEAEKEREAESGFEKCGLHLS